MPSSRLRLLNLHPFLVFFCSPNLCLGLHENTSPSQGPTRKLQPTLNRDCDSAFLSRCIAHQSTVDQFCMPMATVAGCRVTAAAMVDSPSVGAIQALYQFSGNSKLLTLSAYQISCTCASYCETWAESVSVLGQTFSLNIPGRRPASSVFRHTRYAGTSGTACDRAGEWRAQLGNG
jgi:hypothetical protein